MFLSRQRIYDIATSHDEPLFADSSFDSSCLQQASYDLRLGANCFLVGSDFPHTMDVTDPYLLIAPGQFAFLTTFESVHIPASLIGFITLRNSYKQQGLVNISGFHVDPTFKGPLTFAVQNVGPSDLRLKFKERTFTLLLAEVDGDAGYKRAELAGDPIPLSLIQHLGGSTVTLAKLQKDLDELKTRMLIYAPLAVAALVPLLLLLLNLLKSSGH